MVNKSCYYMEKSAFVENSPLVKVIRNYIWDSSGIIFMDIDDVISRFYTVFVQKYSNLRI